MKNLVVAAILVTVPQFASAAQTNQLPSQKDQVSRAATSLCEITRTMFEREFAGNMVKPLLSAAMYATPSFLNNGNPTAEELQSPRNRVGSLSKIVRAATPNSPASVATAERAKAELEKLYSDLAMDIQKRLGDGNDSSSLHRFRVIEQGSGLNDVPVLKLKWPFKVREASTGLIRNARIHFAVDLTATGNTHSAFSVEILVEPQSSFKGGPAEVPIEYAMNAPFKSMNMEQFLNYQLPSECHIAEPATGNYTLTMPSRDAYPVSAEDSKNPRSLPTSSGIQVRSSTGGAAR